MSKNEQNENLEGVVSNEIDAELVELEKEARKAKLLNIAINAGKVACVVAVGIIGFVLGAKSANKSESDDSELIDVEIETEQSDE